MESDEELANTRILFQFAIISVVYAGRNKQMGKARNHLPSTAESKRIIKLQQSWMEQSKLESTYLQELPKANPIQKKSSVLPRSLYPLLPLPQFRFSSEQIELGPAFAVRQSKQSHTLQEPCLSKLFEQPLFQANPKYIKSADNLKFACLKAFYSESGIHPAPQENPLTEELNFESRFESGNLAFAVKSTADNQYYLLLQKDVNTTRCTQWFFFRIRNGCRRGRVRFHILNFLKKYSSFENGMKIAMARQSSGYCWTRGCEDIRYVKNNIKTKGQKTYYTLSFTYELTEENDTIFFAHSPPYTYSMLDRYLLDITNSPNYSSIFKRKTLTESPGGNYIELLTITNFKSKREKKTTFITSRVHPGQTPSSFVCQGIIDFLLSNSEEAKKLRENFIFKVVPMLNPDGVINGNYRCSLSGYDLNRVWHFENKTSSPEVYFTKRAILQNGDCFLFIDLHAHSKKKGVFMYGCQNRTSPFISRHIPYLLWKEISEFNYYQCNFAMKIGRQGTSRLFIHHLLNLPYSYTMEHSFCSSIKDKHHFTSKNYMLIGQNLCLTLKKYFCSKEYPQEIFKELQGNKELMKVGSSENVESSDDSDLDQPMEFKEIEKTRSLKRKLTANIRPKFSFDLFTPSPPKLAPKYHISRDVSPKKAEIANFFPSFYQKIVPESAVTKKLVLAVEFGEQQSIIEEQNAEESCHSVRLEPSNQSSPEKDPQIVVLRSTSRYQFQEFESLNNLFLPSITSASYKRYSKKKSYIKPHVQVGRRFLQSNGFLKEEIRSTSKKKPNWKEQMLSYM